MEYLTLALALLDVALIFLSISYSTENSRLRREKNTAWELYELEREQLKHCKWLAKLYREISKEEIAKLTADRDKWRELAMKEEGRE